MKDSDEAILADLDVLKGMLQRLRESGGTIEGVLDLHAEIDELEDRAVQLGAVG